MDAVTEAGTGSGKPRTVRAAKPGGTPVRDGTSSAGQAGRIEQEMDKQEIERVINSYPISAWAWPRVLVFIPLERAISNAEQVFYNFLYIAMQGPQFVEVNYGRIDLVRNLAVLELLKSNFTHLLMLDIDHKHPLDIIQRLARWVMLYPEVRIVSGMNFRRNEPFDPVAGIYDPQGERMILSQWEPGLVKVDETGAASLLVAREVYEKLDPPWFANDYSRVWENNWIGEDISFCRRAKAAGFEIYMDTTTVSPHCSAHLVNEQTFRTYLQLHPEKMVREEPGVAEGSEGSEVSEEPEVPKVSEVSDGPEGAEA